MRPEGPRPDRGPSCRRVFVVVPEPSCVFGERPASRTAARQLSRTRARLPAAGRAGPRGGVRPSALGRDRKLRRAAADHLRTCSTSGPCFPASRKLPRRCCRTTHWRWSSWIRTVISYARPTRPMTSQTRRSSRTRPRCPESSSSPTSPPRHCRSLNPRTRSRP